MDRSQGFGNEFQEIGHCGGQATINVKTIDGKRAASFGISHSRPTAAAWFAIYVLPQGIPVQMIAIGGLGQPWPAPPFPGCIPVFVASDITGMFGHQCPKCDGYWRSRVGPPAYWNTTCPYCGAFGSGFQFLTEGQKRYVQSFAELVMGALASEHDGEHIVDMDYVADSVNSKGEKPKFYYSEKSQQCQFTCVACSNNIDILGRYGFCSCCGTHNGYGELKTDIDRIRQSVNGGTNLDVSLKEAVSSFDSLAGKIAEHLKNMVPLSSGRKKKWDRKLFHNFKSTVDDFKETFDINLLDGLPSEDVAFTSLMFHRRHVYEHKGGEADEKYISDSGDRSVKPKQLLRETSASVLRLLDIILKVTENLLSGFHELFPVEKQAIGTKLKPEA